MRQDLSKQLQRNVLDTKFGKLQFVESEREQDGVTSRKETNIYTMEGKYITFIKAYWWDKDGIFKALDNERTEDLIYDKIGMV